MGQNRQRTTHPLKTDSTFVVQGLEELFARLLGEIDKHLEGKPALIEEEDAVHYGQCVLDLMPLLGAKLDIDNVKPIRTQAFTEKLPHGEVTRTVRIAIKHATDWMTPNQVFDEVNRLTKTRHLSAEAAARRLQTVRQTLHKMKDRGEVVPFENLEPGDGDSRQRWARPRLAVKLAAD